MEKQPPMSSGRLLKRIDAFPRSSLGFSVGGRQPIQLPVRAWWELRDVQVHDLEISIGRFSPCRHGVLQIGQSNVSTDKTIEIISF